eukprot:6321719-Alexandrium_andersonii.AAC.1
MQGLTISTPRIRSVSVRARAIYGHACLRQAILLHCFWFARSRPMQGQPMCASVSVRARESMNYGAVLEGSTVALHTRRDHCEHPHSNNSNSNSSSNSDSKSTPYKLQDR